MPARRSGLIAGLLMGIVALIAGIVLLMPIQEPRMPNWSDFKNEFVTNEGRVVDTGNNNISHSEGQSWGMLLAVANHDRESFDRIWHWTKQNLQVRDDALFAWRWLPDQPQAPVPDMNNASDAEIYISWALLRAARQWSQPEYEDEARRILASLEEKAIRDFAGMTVLLPGEYGFEKDSAVVLNLSYWIFPAFRDFTRAGLGDVWERLHNSGIKLLEKARFGQWELPADWIALKQDGEVSIAEGFPERFSYDAIRVPLMLHWAQIERPDLLRPYINYTSHFDAADCHPAAWTNLEDNSLAPYPVSAGADDVFGLLDKSRKWPQFSLGSFFRKPSLKPQDYYSISLSMLAHLASQERGEIH